MVLFLPPLILPYITPNLLHASDVELLLPILQDSKLWRETGRWKKYGKELFSLNDRKKNLYYFAF